MQTPRQDESGFTLIELLVVIIIIGILASIAVPTFLGQRSRAHNAAMKTDLRNISNNAETFYADNGDYLGFEADPFFTDYNRTQGVTLDVLDENIDDFCIHATHTNVTDEWYFDSNGSPQLNQTGC